MAVSRLPALSRAVILIPGFHPNRDPGQEVCLSELNGGGFSPFPPLPNPSHQLNYSQPPRAKTPYPVTENISPPQPPDQQRNPIPKLPSLRPPNRPRFSLNFSPPRGEKDTYQQIPTLEIPSETQLSIRGWFWTMLEDHSRQPSEADPHFSRLST